MRPFAIAVAPNGARRTKADHPSLPMSPDEIGRDAAAAKEAGASMIHLHVRDRDGSHILDADLYRQAIDAVNRETGGRMLVQITTEAVGRYQPPAQIAVVDAVRPQSASVALKEIVPDEASESEAAAFFTRCEKAGTLVQLIVYEPGELARLDGLVARGIVPWAAPSVLAVLGRYSGTGATQAEFDAFLAAGLAERPWMLCAFGPAETDFMRQAALAGGHARVGFENNLALPDGSTAPDNAALVEATAKAAAASGRGLASAADLRSLWHRPALV